MTEWSAFTLKTHVYSVCTCSKHALLCMTASITTLPKALIFLKERIIVSRIFSNISCHTSNDGVSHPVTDIEKCGEDTKQLLIMRQNSKMCNCFFFFNLLNS